MTLLTVLAACALVYLLLLFLDRVPWIAAPAKQTVGGAVSVLVILAVVVWAIMVRF